MRNPTRPIAVVIMAAVCVMWSLGGQAAGQGQAAPEVLTNDSVVQMVVGKVPKGIVLTKIQSTPNTFDTTANGLVTLYTSKVPTDLIKAMLAASAPSKEVLTNDAVVKMVIAPLPKELVLTKIQSTTPGFDLTASGLVSLSQNKVPKDIQNAMFAAAAAPSQGSTTPSPRPVAAPVPTAPPPSSPSTPAPTSSAPGGDVNTARHLIDINRGPDQALAILQALPQSQDVLVQTARAYLAEGDGARAMDAFEQVLSSGGEIALEVQHYHNVAYCVGTLYLSAEKVRWVSDSNPTESFGASSSVIMAGSVPNELSLNIDAHRWNFMYLLYGKSGSYGVHGIGSVHPLAYNPADQVNAKKANAIIQDVAVGAKSTKVASVPQPAPAPAPPSPPTPSSVPPTPSPAGGRSGMPCGSDKSPLPNLTEGQSADDVQKLMGKPDRVDPDATDKSAVDWVYQARAIKVILRANKVADVVPFTCGAVGAGA
jgi:hypothetical protein